MFNSKEGITMLLLAVAKVTSTTSMDQLASLSIGIFIVVFVIMAIYDAIRSFVMFFIVRPRDPELYREYRADKRAKRIASSIDLANRNISSSIDSASMNHSLDSWNMTTHIDNDFNDFNNFDHHDYF